MTPRDHLIIGLGRAAAFVAAHWVWFVAGGLLLAGVINGRRAEQGVFRDPTLRSGPLGPLLRPLVSDLALYLYAALLGVTAAVAGLNAIDLALQDRIAADADAVGKEIQGRAQSRLQDRCSYLLRQW